MNANAARLTRRVWHALTEVPGWPDAPRSMRLRRMLPILVPCVAAFGILSWNGFVRDPEIRSVRAGYQSLLRLEEDIELAQRDSSEQGATEIKARAEEVSAQLLASADDAPAFLRSMREKMKTLGWEATFQSYDSPVEPPAPGALVAFSPARARLAPSKGVAASFPALLAVIEEFFSAEKRIDLTRLAIRVDEPGRPTVEINLRVAFRVTHEKTPQ